MKYCRKRLIPFFAVGLLTALLMQLSSAAAPNSAVQNPAAQAPSQSSAAVYVSDSAGVLSDGLKASITERSAALDALTGAQLVVVTVDFLGGATIRDYADDLFNRLQIGDAVKNNGLLLLLAIGEEHYYALQGQGLETALPDAALDALLRQRLEPDFAAGRYKAGIEKTYAGLLTTLEGVYGIGEQGVLAALAQAQAERLHAEKANAQKRLLLLALGVVLLILPALLIAARRRAARRRRLRRRTAE